MEWLNEPPAWTVQGDALDGEAYTMLRLAYLTPVETVSAGVMCASPDGNGFPVMFEGFKIRR